MMYFSWSRHEVKFFDPVDMFLQLFFLILRLYSNKAREIVPDYICNSLDGNLIRKKTDLHFEQNMPFSQFLAK